MNDIQEYRIFSFLILNFIDIFFTSKNDFLMKKNIQVTLILAMLLSSIVFALHKENTDYTSITEIAIETQQDVNFNHGKALFKENCKGCHVEDMVRRGTAPALGGITKRRTKEWLYKYTKNSQKMFVEGDSISITLRNQNWGAKPSFPALSDADLDKIYYYVEKRYEMSLKGIPVLIEFEFKASENHKAIACTHILVEKNDILNVSVSKTRNWIFSCERASHTKSEWKKTTLKAMFMYDKTINELIFLQHDFPVFRKSKESGWDF